MRRTVSIVLAGLAVAAAGALAADPPTLVVCAPGYPGNTVEAQPTMDAFAAALAGAAGRDAATLRAVYHADLPDGLAALERDDAALTVVPLPLYLAHGERRGLQAILAVDGLEGREQTWSLVASRGRIRAPADLVGWTVVGLPGYTPRFVRNVALAGWGRLPDTVEVRASSRVLSDLRRAARGEPVAVLLDTAQAAAMERLPFAADLEVVTRSVPLPGALVCTVRERLDAEVIEAWRTGLVGLHETEAGRGVLATMRIARIAPLDRPALERAERLWRTDAN